MITNLNGSAVPHIHGFAGFVPEEDYRTDHTGHAKTKSLWSSHAICMEGESETDDTAYEPAFDPHMHLIHLIS